MTALVRIFLVAALVAATTAGIAGAARSQTQVLRGCGAVKAAGRTWQVSAAGVACSSAKALVRKFAGKVPASGAVGLGTYLSMKCTGFAKPGKHFIECTSTTGKLVTAVAK